MAENYYHFEGDPATDSARRQMERLLKESRPRHRRWPWVAAALAGAAAWYFWPRGTSAGTEAAEKTTETTPVTKAPKKNRKPKKSS